MHNVLGCCRRGAAGGAQVHLRSFHHLRHTRHRHLFGILSQDVICQGDVTGGKTTDISMPEVYVSTPYQGITRTMASLVPPHWSLP